MVMGLRDVQINDSVEVASVTVNGEMGRRIRDMGLIPGAHITVIGRAPLLDPVALRVKGFTLTLRNNEADHILVRAAGEEVAEVA